MWKIIFVIIILGLGFGSCNKETQPLTKQEIKQKIDSITKIRIKELDEQSRVDLEHRIKIEVKVKVDSIFNARMAQKIKTDSLLNAKIQLKTKDSSLNKNVIAK